MKVPNEGQRMPKFAASYSIRCIKGTKLPQFVASNAVVCSKLPQFVASNASNIASKAQSCHNLLHQMQ
jgi:hypothetical protein